MRHLLLSFLLATTALLSAEPLQFPDKNFTLEVPAGWENINPPDPKIVAALRSQTGGKLVLVLSAKLPERERVTGASSVRAGMKSSFEKSGMTIDSESTATVGGVPYLTLKAHSSAPKYIHAYITSVDGTIYAFQHISDTDEADGGPGFKSVLEGFKLIQPHPFTTGATTEPGKAP